MLGLNNRWATSQFQFKRLNCFVISIAGILGLFLIFFFITFGISVYILIALLFTLSLGTMIASGFTRYAGFSN